MSVLPLFLMALCVTSFTACSDDDGDGGGGNPLVGTWEESFFNDNLDETIITTFVFNSDGTGVMTVRLDEAGITQDPQSFSYTYNAETEVFRIRFENDATLYSGTASLTGSTLVLRYADTYYSLIRK